MPSTELTIPYPKWDSKPIYISWINVQTRFEDYCASINFILSRLLTKKKSNYKCLIHYSSLNIFLNSANTKQMKIKTSKALNHFTQCWGDKNCNFTSKIIITFFLLSSSSSHSSLRFLASKFSGNLFLLSSSTTSWWFNFLASFWRKCNILGEF